MKSLKKDIFVLSLSLMSFGCYSAPKSDIPGRYVIRDDWGESVLRLEMNGRFVEEAIMKSGEKRRVEGTWEYKAPFLLRKPCLAIQHRGVEERNPDGCDQGVDKYLTGAIEISVSIDDGLAYRKERP